MLTAGEQRENNNNPAFYIGLTELLRHDDNVSFMMMTFTFIFIEY